MKKLIFIRNGKQKKTYSMFDIEKILKEEKIFLVDFPFESKAYLFIDEIYKVANVEQTSYGRVVIKYSLLYNGTKIFSTGIINALKDFAREFEKRELKEISESTKAKLLLLRG